MKSVIGPGLFSFGRTDFRVDFLFDDEAKQILLSAKSLLEMIHVNCFLN